MTQVFDEAGNPVPTTVIGVEPNTVVAKRTKESDGYSACLLGVGVKKNPNRPYAGVFKKSGTKPTKTLHEVRNAPSDWEVGTQVGVNVFTETPRVNVTGYSKGRGFTGCMKRYGWHGGPGGHGSHLHRGVGSMGTSKTPGRVQKGHKLPGRMGNAKVTVKNLRVVKVDEEKKLLFLKGAVPGPNKSWLVVKC
jgi:large subunit ribosomal protein L3